jgi:bacteriorhodopsin
MVILGYPGEISTDMTTRFTWWALSMIPFLYILYALFFGLRASIANQPQKAQPLVRNACYLTVLAWFFYPIVYLLPNMGFVGGDGFVALQVGYSIADIVAKAGFGLLIFFIALSKSSEEGYAEL